MGALRATEGQLYWVQSSAEKRLFLRQPSRTIRLHRFEAHRNRKRV